MKQIWRHAAMPSNMARCIALASVSSVAQPYD